MSNLENIDLQQSMLVKYLSEAGQEEIYQQLDAVQETYLRITEHVTEQVTEVVSKCFSEMVIYQIILDTLLEQIEKHRCGDPTDSNTIVRI